jgi:hypothetical protein
LKKDEEIKYEFLGARIENSYEGIDICILQDQLEEKAKDMHVSPYDLTKYWKKSSKLSLTSNDEDEVHSSNRLSSDPPDTYKMDSISPVVPTDTPNSIFSKFQ